MAERTAFPNVHVVVYHDSENQYVGLDVFSSFEKALEQFDQRLKATRSDHADDPDWIFTLTRDTKRHELYFLDKSGYEVFYRNEVVQNPIAEATLYRSGSDSYTNDDEDGDDEELEFSPAQLERIDEIHNAVYDLCQILTEQEGLEWNMEFIGEIADVACDILVDKGFQIRYPSMVEEGDGSRHIEEYV